jgi:hypothetical protein
MKLDLYKEGLMGTKKVLMKLDLYKEGLMGTKKRERG